MGSPSQYLVVQRSFRKSLTVTNDVNQMLSYSLSLMIIQRIPPFPVELQTYFPVLVDLSASKHIVRGPLPLTMTFKQSEEEERPIGFGDRGADSYVERSSQPQLKSHAGP